MTQLTNATFKARWDELSAQRVAIDAVLDPKRAELDSIVAGTADMTLAEAREREPVLRAEIRALQAELFPIEQERAACARALSGKTG
jgi:hypothetical protein